MIYGDSQVLENDFHNKLGDIYPHSLLRYLSGIGNLMNDSTSLPVSWEFCLDITGTSHFILKHRGRHYHNLEEHSFSGHCNELVGWSINIKKIWITSTISEGLSEVLYCKTPEFIFEKREVEGIQPSKAIAHITNFDFLGLEKTETNGGFILDKFSVDLKRLALEFKLTENSNEIKKLIDTKRINHGVLSYITVVPYESHSLEEIKKEIGSITSFLSSVTLTTNYPQKIEYYDDNNDIVRFDVMDTTKLSFNNEAIIDNFLTWRGLKHLFESSYLKYRELEDSLKLNEFTNRIVDIQNQTFIDNKLAQLIMAYEFLISNYLVSHGLSRDNLEEMNIQKKMTSLNTQLRFIPRELLNDDLRKVRNPLFHTGAIPFMEGNDLYNFYTEYNDLLMRIYLRIIGYDGEYISRKDYKPVQV
ncbi:hypothetical protein [Paenibacillus xylanilyticus]|uniref:ApeA N-terminal domain-containing protein n=1 Tax=Paenibacillus xylanilyticus TaxID=248903 RepID=A0A7Y6BU01_9BACL|nr:hypothetical protein [Paenibacillus xylanilyticus]NUU73969.1 hypothetical protein [Paenibacillus xylanilyticus]